MDSNTSSVPANKSFGNETQPLLHDLAQNRESSCWACVSSAFSEGLKKITSLFNCCHERAGFSQEKGPALGAHEYFLVHEQISHPRETVLPRSQGNPFERSEYALDKAHIPYRFESVSVPIVNSGTFERRHLPLMSVDVSTIQGKELLVSILNSIQGNQDLSPVLQSFLVSQRQNPQNNGLSDVEIIGKQIAVGTCYGQAMNLLEILLSKDLKNCPADSLVDHMEPTKCITYQIASLILCFLHQCGGSRFAYGLDVKKSILDIEKFFPSFDKRKISSEQIALRSLSQRSLVGRISDYIKIHTRIRDDKTGPKDFAIFVTLFRLDIPCGHAAVMYYSENKKEYYWYDPLSPMEGLFFASDLRAFLLGISERLIKYTQPGALLEPQNFAECLQFADIFYTHVYFTAYDLDDADAKSRM